MEGKAGRRSIGDYFTLQRGTTYESRLLGQPGPVLLGLATIHRNGGFRSDSLRTYGGESPEKLLVKPGDLFVSLKDVTQSADLLGAVAMFPVAHAPGRLTQDTVRLEPKSKDVPINYIHWLLRTPQYRSYCRAHATGTTNLGLAREDFLAFPAPEPNARQQLIVQTLDAIEAKIELNRSLNHTLEAMAEALFRSWFVDFDPVGVSEALRRSGSSATAAEVFPVAWENSELGRIPRGWKVVPLGELLELKRGYDLPSSQRGAGAVPVVSSSGVSGSHSEAKVTGPGIVTGRYGTIGKVFFVREDFWPLNTTLYVRDCKGNDLVYLYHQLRLLNFEKFSDKGAVPGINRNHVHEEPVVAAPLTVQERFRAIVSPMLEAGESNQRQSSVLRSLRDALLSQLLTPKSHVRETERVNAGSFSI